MPTILLFARRHWKRLALDFCMCGHIAVMSVLRFDSLLQSRICLNPPEAAGPSYPCSLLSLGIVSRVSSLLLRLPATILLHARAVIPTASNTGNAPLPQELWTFVTMCASSLVMCVIISAPKFYLQHARSYLWLAGNVLTAAAAFSSLILYPHYPASLYQTRYLHITGPVLMWQQIVLQYDRATGLAIALVWFSFAVLQMLLLPIVHPEVQIPWWAIPFLTACTLDAVLRCLRLHRKHMNQLAVKNAFTAGAAVTDTGLHASVSGTTAPLAHTDLLQGQTSAGLEAADVFETSPRGQVLKHRHFFSTMSVNQGSGSSSSDTTSFAPLISSIPSSSPEQLCGGKLPTLVGTGMEPSAMASESLDTQTQQTNPRDNFQQLLRTLDPTNNAMFRPEGAIETISTTIYGLQDNEIPADFLEQLNRSLMSDPSNPRMIVSASLRKV